MTEKRLRKSSGRDDSRLKVAWDASMAPSWSVWGEVGEVEQSGGSQEGFRCIERSLTMMEWSSSSSLSSLSPYMPRVGVAARRALGSSKVWDGRKGRYE